MQYTITNFSIELNVFNTKNAKCLMDLLNSMKQNVKKPIPKIHWIYTESDKEMKEMGKLYSQFLDMKFNFIEKSSN